MHVFSTDLTYALHKYARTHTPLNDSSLMFVIWTNLCTTLLRIPHTCPSFTWSTLMCGAYYTFALNTWAFIMRPIVIQLCSWEYQCTAYACIGTCYVARHCTLSAYSAVYARSQLHCIIHVCVYVLNGTKFK